MFICDFYKLLLIFFFCSDSFLVPFSFRLWQQVIINRALDFLVNIFVLVDFSLVLYHFFDCFDVIIANGFVQRGFWGVNFPLKALDIIRDVLWNLNSLYSFLLIFGLFFH